MKFFLLTTGLFLCSILHLPAQSQTPPLRLAVIGISHGHSGWIFDRTNKMPLNVVGVYEPDTTLAGKYIRRYRLDPSLFHTDLNSMLEKTRPEAAVAFGSIYDHLQAVEACAPRGIHVMVEKPLAVNMDHAEKMARLAKKHNIMLLTNYETSWYPTTERTYQLVHDSNFVGRIRKVVIHDGHQGPKEIGVGPEFFNWLTDPVKNGGGALIDFGCYGANLMTWLMKGEMPVSVNAVTATHKPHIYPKVDDEATVIVSYDGAQCIIQASWNWPFNRKDMEVYGEKAYIFAENKNDIHTRGASTGSQKKYSVTTSDVQVYEDPFVYFTDAVRGKIKVPENGLYSLENNLSVVMILDAARESARTGRKIDTRPYISRLKALK